MNILMTGGAGFIGSHLTEAFLKKGYFVTCVDNLSTGSYKNIQHYKSLPNYKFVFGSVESLPSLETLIADADCVFHLAASVGVKNVVENPIHCIENNVFCTSLILRLADRYKKRVLTFSTSEVYGKTKSFPFKEENDITLGPVHKLRWAYAASKLIDDYLSRAYFTEKNTAVTIVRLFNTIGRGQVGHYGMVVPRFFEAALAGKPITVYGTGEQSRCFSDVRDVVASLIALIDCPESYGELVNIGTPNEVSIRDLAAQVKSLTNSPSEIRYISFTDAYGENFEDMDRRVPCNEKLIRLTGYHFKYNLADTLGWIHRGLTSQTKVHQLFATEKTEAIL